MFSHHAETIRRTSEHFSSDPAVKGLLLAGSIAHGFCTEESDVDVMIVVSDEDHRERLRSGRTCFFSRELCTYEAGYVDGKYVSEGLLRQVSVKGSEPARYAFQDAKILFAQSETLGPLIQEIARYPREERESRIFRFQAQFEAWLWYTSQALKQQNLHLLRLAVAKLTLFGGRTVLAHNEMLYPYHKWFLRVLATAPQRPERLLTQIDELAREPTRELIDAFASTIRGFRPWRADHTNWPAQFMADSELNWLDYPPPIDDV